MKKLSRSKIITTLLLPSREALMAFVACAVLFLSAGYVSAGVIWTPTRSMATARYEHTETLLPNGKVLVVGGSNGGSLASAELYDPATGTWAPTGSLGMAREHFTATLLPN